MISFLILFFAISLLFISCKKELKPQYGSVSSKVVPFTEVENQQKNQNKLSNEPIRKQNTVNQIRAVLSAFAVGKGMNPDQTQAIHRSDIAVDAPLNSEVVPTKNNTTSTQMAPQQNRALPITIVAPKPTLTPEGMNLLHSQEIRHCNIAVGAPLLTE